MKGRVVLLDQIGDRPAAALMVDGRLEDLVIDPAGDEAMPGAIYRAVADRPVKGQGGMFVKLPGGSGFLRQVGGVAPGQRLLVQVSGPAEPGKAAPVTSHAGRAGTEHQPPHSRRGRARGAGCAGDCGHGGRGGRAGTDPAVCL